MHNTRKLAFLSNRNTIVQIKLKNYGLSLIYYSERKISCPIAHSAVLGLLSTLHNDSFVIFSKCREGRMVFLTRHGLSFPVLAIVL